MAQTKVFGITIGKKPTAPKPVEQQEAPVIKDFVASLPAVNALPLKIREGYQDKALIKKFAAGAIALVLIFGGMAGYSFYSQVQNAVQVSQTAATGADLNKKITALQPYDTYKINVGGKITTLSTYLAKDVDAAKIIKILFDDANQNGISFSAVSLSIPTTSTTPGAAATSSGGGSGSCVSTDPFNAVATIGCITVKGNQTDANSLNNFFNTLGTTPGFVNVFIADSSYGSSGSGATSNTFDGSVAFTSALYSNKYSNYSLPIDILLKNGLDAAPGATAGTSTTVVPTTTPTAHATNQSTPRPTPSGVSTNSPTGNPTPTSTSTSGKG